MANNIQPKEIELVRGQAGLGFNIKGGVDIPHLEGDPGIFVAKIREKGAAAEAGTLHEGDKIVEVNGQNVERVQHQQAVACFLNAGSRVTLKIIPGAEAAIRGQKDGGSSSGGSNAAAIAAIAVVGLAILGVTVFAGYKYKVIPLEKLGIGIPPAQ